MTCLSAKPSLIRPTERPPSKRPSWALCHLKACSTSWEFDYNAALALRAEELGFDLVFGLSEWVRAGGYGGKIRFREDSIDPFMTVTALAALTKRLLLLSTIHILYGPWHPMHLARFAATADHISKGRFGINVVTGFSPAEPLMFGMRRQEHDLRYEMADEFMSIAKRLWQSEHNFTYEGQFWRLEDAFVRPKPRYGRPILVSATGSPAGFSYAARHSDLAFITSPAGANVERAVEALPAHTAKLKAEALSLGRNIRTIINPMIVCRETEAEARAYYDEIIRVADTEAAAGYANHFKSGDSKAWNNHVPLERILGGNVHLIGSPEQVADWFIALNKAGCDGMQISFYDFAKISNFSAKLCYRCCSKPGSGDKSPDMHSQAHPCFLLEKTWRLEGLPPGKAPIRALHVGDPSSGDAEKVWFEGPRFWLERDPVGEDAVVQM
ncbi:LLM class flavin-dependent oxidoreductase [Bradyrhizobium sp. CCBAU 45394]|uniref:LLM class flavin-dependent oxidoreductase n=2 Tax=unclassified Bradyrhizobium TaxID=2631580 RepID=UPI002302D015|nr:LLM class flavin-dependent oxidoreductase [Bradyrhizobium sp. CCBAU 45394]